MWQNQTQSVVQRESTIPLQWDCIDYVNQHRRHELVTHSTIHTGMGLHQRHELIYFTKHTQKGTASMTENDCCQPSAEGDRMSDKSYSTIGYPHKRGKICVLPCQTPYRERGLLLPPQCMGTWDARPLLGCNQHGQNRYLDDEIYFVQSTISSHPSFLHHHPRYIDI